MSGQDHTNTHKYTHLCTFLCRNNHKSPLIQHKIAKKCWNCLKLILYVKPDIYVIVVACQTSQCTQVHKLIRNNESNIYHRIDDNSHLYDNSDYNHGAVLKH